MIVQKIGKYKLPQPLDLKEDNEWLPIPRIARTIPFGYRLDEEDKDLLQPVPDELDLLEKAKDFLKRYSSREVAHWLSKHSGRYISHVGLLKRIKNEHKNKNKARIYSRWANFAEKARQKAEKIETERLGSKKPKSDEENESATTQ